MPLRRKLRTVMVTAIYPKILIHSQGFFKAFGQTHEGDVTNSSSKKKIARPGQTDNFTNDGNVVGQITLDGLPVIHAKMTEVATGVLSFIDQQLIQRVLLEGTYKKSFYWGTAMF